MNNFKINEQTSAIIKYAQKKGVLLFSPQALEIDHTHYPEINATTNREGFYAEDITGFWQPSSLAVYLQSNWTNFKEAWAEFGFFKAFKFLSIIPPWTGWAWVVDSTKTIAYEIVDEKLRNLSKKERSEAYKNYEELCNKVSQEEIYTYLNKNYIKIKDHLWVSESDSSVIVYDPIAKPYKLRDGWSKEQVGEILSEWMEAVAKVKVPAKFVENAPW